MANAALLHKRVFTPLLATLFAAALSAGSPAKEAHRRSIYYRPNFSGPTEKYVVQKGDLLSCIAAWSGTTVCTLAEVNHICNPDIIVPGETLIVPGGKKSTTVVVPCVLNKHNHPSTAGLRHTNATKHQGPLPEKPAAIDWAALLRLRLSVEVEGNNPPRIQVTPIMFVPATESMMKDNSTPAGEWKTIHIGGDVYRVRVTIPETSPAATLESKGVSIKEVQPKKIPAAKATEKDPNSGPDVKTYFASEKK